jgi:hypothetical protein
MDEMLMDNIFELLEEGMNEGWDMASGTRDEAEFRKRFNDGIASYLNQVRELLFEEVWFSKDEAEPDEEDYTNGI